MKRSTDRIITTQVGSLPRPNDLRKLWDDRLAQRPSFDQAAYEARVKTAVAEMVKQQAECGIDVVSDGEQGRLGWTAFLPERLAGFEERPQTGAGGGGVTGRERAKGEFDGYTAERARLTAWGEGRETRRRRKRWRRYARRPSLPARSRTKASGRSTQEIANFKAALAASRRSRHSSSVGPTTWATCRARTSSTATRKTSARLR